MNGQDWVLYLILTIKLAFFTLFTNQASFFHQIIKIRRGKEGEKKQEEVPYLKQLGPFYCFLSKNN